MPFNEDDKNELDIGGNIDNNSKDTYEMLKKINDNIVKNNRITNRIWVLIIIIVIVFISLYILAPIAYSFLLIPSYNFLVR